MPDYADTLGAHVEVVADDARAFSLVMDKDGWTASATRKHARNPVTAAGATPIEAVANLLTTMRGEPEDQPDVGQESGETPEG